MTVPDPAPDAANGLDPATPTACQADAHESPSAMPADATGHWVIRTRNTTQLIDLDETRYMRVPGQGRKAMEYDREWLQILRFGRLPVLGEQMLIYVDPPDPLRAMVEELWRVSATILSLEQAEPGAFEAFSGP